MAIKLAGLALAANALFLSGHAFAVNKCVGQDGKIVYQQAECPADVKQSQRINVEANGSSGGGSDAWKFRRSLDEMTGKVACLVTSPISFPVRPQPNGFYPVHAVVSVGANGAPVFGMRTSENKTLFHNDLDGMGLKTSAGEFIPLPVKVGSHVVAPLDSAGVLAQLEIASELQARVRFWPYEQLYDIKPIPTVGFRSALTQAKACAASLK